MDWPSILVGAAAGAILAAFLAVPFTVWANRIFERKYRPRALVFIGPSSTSTRKLPIGRRIQRRLRGLGPVSTITIATDAGFIDTSLFFLAVDSILSKVPEAQLVYRHVAWNEIPHEVGRADNVIAYVNRRMLPRISPRATVWSNLAAFRGYALIGRREDFPEAVPDLESANRALERFAARRTLTVMSFGAECLEILRTPLTPMFNSGRVSRVSFDSNSADHAFELFQRGHGDLLLATLPQRLDCRGREDLVEIFSSQTNPLFSGIDALAYRGDGIDPDLMEKVVEQISIAWSRHCRRVVADEAFCRASYRRWLEIAENLAIRPVRFTEDDFVLVLHREAGKYVRLFRTCDDSARELIRASKWCLEESGLRRRTDIEAALSALYESYTGVDGPRRGAMGPARGAAAS